MAEPAAKAISNMERIGKKYCLYYIQRKRKVKFFGHKGKYVINPKKKLISLGFFILCKHIKNNPSYDASSFFSSYFPFTHSMGGFHRCHPLVGNPCRDTFPSEVYRGDNDSSV